MCPGHEIASNLICLSLIRCITVQLKDRLLTFKIVGIRLEFGLVDLRSATDSAVLANLTAR